MTTYTLNCLPIDFHVHFRQDDMLSRVVRETADVFARAMVMPNTDPAIANGDDVNRYRQEIMAAIRDTGGNESFEPLMTFKITPQTTGADVISAKEAGAIAGKLYPDGVTTGSEGGVRDFKALYPIFEQMSELGLVLSIHGESPDAFCIEREREFIPILDDIAFKHRDLRIVLEHLSTKDSIQQILDNCAWRNVAGTITVHHLELTLDDVVGGHLHPHFFCKPLAKRPEDREALLHAALSGNPKIFFGSDSAPHPRNKKECSDGCAGVYSAPVALPVLVQIFEHYDLLEYLEPFVSHFGADFYGLPRSEGEITLVQKDWVVKQTDPDLVPYKVGETLRWQVQHN